ncbi:hypothetical protein C479_10295 [Halovivax asiaticus JCM 14624]|uniref:DUF1616 domain-containing protein n=1 Tax=Halovivax asiaticus JCM 14624 TaxID=1227490 RepID=M0BGD4_9EURY|nr:DUF1616 domain-containing protein [Halovivax asiaticus]ELZ09956.1 hypothetical protein C479_10295 [Halovivax asiaticus JCM 14624]
MDVRTLRLMVPRPIRELPADLAAVVVLVLAADVAALAPLIRETPLRIPLGLALVLFLPGYTFVAALFPEAGESPTGDGVAPDADSTAADTDRDAENAGSDGTAEESDAGRSLLSTPPTVRGIDGIERVALSFGLSIAIVPLLGLVLNFTPWGIRLVPIVLTVTGFTIGATVVAAVRRWDLPPEERFRVPYRQWVDAAATELFEPETRVDTALNVALALSVVLAVGAVGFAILVPPQGEQFSAIYYLTEDEDGELVADGYPSELVRGESATLVVGVDNHEHERTEYTVVLVEQRVEFVNGSTGEPVTRSTGNSSANATAVVADQRELNRFQTTLSHNESWHHEHEVTPTFTGENVRIVWLLFPGGDAPAEPSMADTEYAVHLWLDVAEANESGE